MERTETLASVFNSLGVISKRTFFSCCPLRKGLNGLLPSLVPPQGLCSGLHWGGMHIPAMALSADTNSLLVCPSSRPFSVNSGPAQHHLSPKTQPQRTAQAQMVYTRFICHLLRWAHTSLGRQRSRRYTVTITCPESQTQIKKGSYLYHKLLWDYHNDTFVPKSIYTMECAEGTFLTLKIYTLESLKQKYLYLYMRPTRKRNIENKGNVPAPQVVPFRGKVALLSIWQH